jgi:type VI secretion system secreted protein VgrG
MVDGLPSDALVVTSFHLSQSFSELLSLDISLVSQQLLSIDFSRVLEKPTHLKI